MSDIPNAVIEGPPAQPEPVRGSSAMKVLERVTNKEVQIPASIPVTKPKEKTDEKELEYDFFDEKESPEKSSPLTDKYPVSEDTDDIDKIIDIKASSSENMKKLRNKLKVTHTERDNLKVEAETLRKKVTEYESGLVVPEQLQSLQSRIDELEPFEKLYNLKASPEYREAIAVPLENIKAKIIDIAKDYEVPLEVLDQALATTNRADLNRLLTQHFDEVGALEVKSLLNNMKEINQKAVEAEKAPSAALARLHKQTNEAIEAKRQIEVDGIIAVSKSAWAESLSALREADHTALSFRDGDTEHNETVVRPTLNKAARDYGMAIKGLGEHGLKQLPPEIAYYMSRSTQLAHESAILRQQVIIMSEELTTLRKRVGNLNTMNRPGTNGGGQTSSSGSTPSGGTAASRALARAQANK